MIGILKWGLVFLLIFSPIFKGGKEIAPLTFIQLFIIILTIIYLINLRKSGTRDISTGWLLLHKTNILDYLIVCFVIMVIISTFRSIYLYASIIEVFKIISYVLLYYLVFNLVNKNEFKNKILNTIVLISTVIALVGIYQHFSGKTPSVTFPNENLLAGYLAIGITLALSKLIIDVKWQIIYENRDKYIVPGMLYLVSIVIMFICLIYTRSRGGMLSLIAVVIFLSVMRFKKRGFIFILSCLVLVSVLLPQDYIVKLLKISLTDPYAMKRFSIWTSGIKAIMTRPILGWGLGTFGYIFYRYNFPVTGGIARYGKVTRFAHNEFIQMGLEAGLLVLIILVCMIIVVFRKGMKEASVSSDSQRWPVIASFSSLIAILTHSLVDFNLHLPTIAILFIFFSAIVMNNSVIKKHDPEKITSKVLVPAVIGLLILSILISMPYIGHLYSKQENYKKAICFNPLYSSYYAALGNIYSQKFKDTQEEKWQILSLQEYKKAIKLNPEYPYNYQDLASFYYNDARDLNKTIENYKKAIQRAPYDASLYFYLGSIYSNEKMFAKAISVYKKAIEIEPNYLRVYYRLGIAYEEMNQTMKAISLYNRIIEILNKDLISSLSYNPLEYEKELLSFDGSLAYNRLGLLYIKENKTDKAIANYREALKINPEYAEAYNNLGGAYYKMGLYALALDECRKALKIEPENRQFKKNLLLSLEKLEQDIK